MMIFRTKKLISLLRRLKNCVTGRCPAAAPACWGRSWEAATPAGGSQARTPPPAASACPGRWSGSACSTRRRGHSPSKDRSPPAGSVAQGLVLLAVSPPLVPLLAVAGVEDHLLAAVVQAGRVPPHLPLLAEQPVLVPPLLVARPQLYRLVQVAWLPQHSSFQSQSSTDVLGGKRKVSLRLLKLSDALAGESMQYFDQELLISPDARLSPGMNSSGNMLSRYL